MLHFFELPVSTITSSMLLLRLEILDFIVLRKDEIYDSRLHYKYGKIYLFRIYSVFLAEILFQ